MISTSNQQRGSILIYSMMTMAVMLAIGTALSGLFVARLKRVGAVSHAVRAIDAADSAAERCLYEARHAVVENLTMTNGATYAIVGGPLLTIDVTADCSSLATASFQFRATGTYQGATRALEISQ